jgi:hypothetical protein
MRPSLVLWLALATGVPGASARADAPTRAASDCPASLPAGPIGSPVEDLARVAELTGAAAVRPRLFLRWSGASDTALCPGAPPDRPAETLSLRPLPLTWRTYLDTGYPDDRNDGALWQGRGLSTELTGGLGLRWRAFSAAVAPVAAWQQNRDFFHPAATFPGSSPYANPFNGGGIDLPLRFGPTDFWTFDPGQSYARVDAYGAALGVSTENLWWGPGTRNALLMTNSGPGFPHLFLGTSTPQDIWIGRLEAQLVWGRLSRSKWFLEGSAGSHRLFTAVTMGYEPRWVPNLFLGFARAFLFDTAGLPTREYLSPVLRFFTNANGGENQLISLFGRWVFPESGLEIYGEWGRDDFSAGFDDLVQQPEHAQAFMLGLQKVFPAGRRWVRLVAELAHTLEKPTNNPTRGVPIFYTHLSAEPEGYTNDGQMIGAGIGPQADSQYLALDLFSAGGRAGVWFERVLRNDRYFYDQVHTLLGQDAELAAGLRGLASWRELDVDWSLGLGHRYNLNFGPTVNSLKGMLAVTWWPGRVAAPGLPRPQPQQPRER